MMKAEEDMMVAMKAWAILKKKDGLIITAIQSVGKALLFIITIPFGVCIQLLVDIIQKAEAVAPPHTRKVAKKCVLLFTALQPNSIMPKNPASKKKAVSTS